MRQGTGKAKAIGSNPLAGFQVQTYCKVGLAIGLGDRDWPHGQLGLIKGLMNNMGS